MMSQAELEQLADLVADRLADRVSATLVEQAGKKYLSRQEYADSHGLSLRTVDRLLAEGKLTKKQVGSRVLIPVS